MLQMQMKEHGIMDPEELLDVNIQHSGARLDVIDPEKHHAVTQTLTQRETKKSLEKILESLVTVLSRKKYVEQEEYGEVYL
jgi:hypothetical protein